MFETSAQSIIKLLRNRIAEKGSQNEHLSTMKQQRMLHMQIESLRRDCYQLVGFIVGREISSTKELSIAEASVIIDWLLKGEDVAPVLAELARQRGS